MIKNYYVELSKKPKAQIESRLSYDGKHFLVDTPYDLKGRGIAKVNTIFRKDSYKYWHEWKTYRVTKKAYNILSKKFDIAYEVYFD